MAVEDDLIRAKDAVARQDRAAALQILSKVIKSDARNVEAWLLIAGLVDDPKHIEDSLRRVLAVEPDHADALQRLRDLKEPLQAGPIQPVRASTQPPSAADELVEPEVEYVKPAVSTPPRSGRGIEIALMVVAGLLACFVVTAIGISAIGNLASRAPAATATLEDVTGVVFSNIQAVNAENINAYMATIHPDSPGYDQTEQTLPVAFGQFDLSYRITGVQVLEQDSREAVVAFVLTTRKIRGPEFRDNVVTGQFILRKHDGVWKIYDQEIENIEYLN
jgi:hypothetical protein